jgi:hypothetical protein
MSIEALDKAFEIINENIEIADFEGEKDEYLIQLAEKMLGISFPESYRKFLTKLGCGDIAGEEFYGIIDDNFETSTVPNGIWLTLNQRKSSNMPENLLIVYSLGDGSYYALDISKKAQNGDCPVVRWIPGLSKKGEKLDVIAVDFGEFFLKTIEESLDNKV